MGSSEIITHQQKDIHFFVGLVSNDQMRTVSGMVWSMEESLPSRQRQGHVRDMFPLSMPELISQGGLSFSQYFASIYF